jgi:hypothetical protein
MKLTCLFVIFKFCAVSFETICSIAPITQKLEGEGVERGRARGMERGKEIEEKGEREKSGSITSSMVRAIGSCIVGIVTIFTCQ